MQRTGVLPAIEARAPANVTYRLDDQGSLAGDPVDRGTLSLDARGTLALSATTPLSTDAATRGLPASGSTTSS